MAEESGKDWSENFLKVVSYITLVLKCKCISNFIRIGQKLYFYTKKIYTHTLIFIHMDRYEKTKNSNKWSKIFSKEMQKETFDAWINKESPSFRIYFRKRMIFKFLMIRQDTGSSKVDQWFLNFINKYMAAAIEIIYAREQGVKSEIS